MYYLPIRIFFQESRSIFSKKRGERKSKGSLTILVDPWLRPSKPYPVFQAAYRTQEYTGTTSPGEEDRSLVVSSFAEQTRHLYSTVFPSSSHDERRRALIYRTMVAPRYRRPRGVVVPRSSSRITLNANFFLPNNVSGTFSVFLIQPTLDGRTTSLCLRPPRQNSFVYHVEKGRSVISVAFLPPI